MNPTYNHTSAPVASHSSSEEYEGTVRKRFTKCDVKLMS